MLYLLYIHLYRQHTPQGNLTGSKSFHRNTIRGAGYICCIINRRLETVFISLCSDLRNSSQHEEINTNLSLLLIILQIYSVLLMGFSESF